MGDTNVRFSNTTPDILISNQANLNMQDEPEPLEPEKVVLLSLSDKHNDLAAEHGCEEMMDEIMINTDKLFIKECPSQDLTGSFANSDVDTIFDVYNGSGENVFKFGRVRDKRNVQTFIIANTGGQGVGLLTLTTSGFLNQICEVEGSGLLKFTQIHHITGGYTLRDKWKELLKIRTSWVPFCTCCLAREKVSATLAVVNLDGTPTGTICYKKWLNLGFEDRTLCVHFIPNLNHKAKYMLFAASLKPLCNYFSEPGRSRRIGSLYCTYLALFIVLVSFAGIIAKFLKAF